METFGIQERRYIFHFKLGLTEVLRKREQENMMLRRVELKSNWGN